MKNDRLKICAAVTIAAALLYSMGGMAAVIALALPVAVHELSHVAALHALGLHVKCVSAELKGLRIDYIGCTSAAGHIFAAAAGPAGGMLFALLCSWLGNLTGQSLLSLTAGVSLLLSVFNLLPALPLDGGRILLHLCEAHIGEERGRSLCRLSGILVGALVFCLGLWFAVKGLGSGVLAAGIYILLSQSEDTGLVKKDELI